MAKHRYIRPVLMEEMTTVEPPTYEFGGSQGTSGYDMYEFDFPDDYEDFIDVILLNVESWDLEEMDVDGNHIITWTEFNNWYEKNGPF